MATITKKVMIDRIAETHQVRRVTAQRIIQSLLEEIGTELTRGNRLEFRGFGVFEVKRRAPRISQNPKTLEKIQVPARRAVKFKMGRLMTEKLNMPAEESGPKEPADTLL